MFRFFRAEAGRRRRRIAPKGTEQQSWTTYFKGLGKVWLKPLPLLSVGGLLFYYQKSKQLGALRAKSNETATSSNDPTNKQPLNQSLGWLGLSDQPQTRRVITVEPLKRRHADYMETLSRYAKSTSTLIATANTVAIPTAAVKVETDKEPPVQASSNNPTANAFVLSFKGDILATQVQNLREEITAIMQIADAGKGDEVVVVLHSGGGTVTGYGLAAAQLERVKTAGLKLTVCVDEVAASGGYMMASVADQIVAAPFATLGSIGVISTQPNIKQLLERMGIEVEDITAGQFKRTMVPYKTPSDEDRSKVQQDVDLFHREFKTHIKKYRAAVDIDKVATGETWFGSDALGLKLIDTIATSDQVLLGLMKTKDVFIIKHQLYRKSGPFGGWQPINEVGEKSHQAGVIADVISSVITRVMPALNGSVGKDH